jgi:spermidine/putrescine transport system permease protein
LYKIKIRPRSGHRNSEFRIKNSELKNGVYKLKTLSKVYMGLVLMFLYVPIFVLIVFSFNETKSRSVFSGFTLDWYAKLFRNEVIISSLMNTIIIAVIASIAATLLGTLAAIGINSMRKVPKAIVMNITNMPIVNPEIVTGVSLMLLFVFFAARMNLEFGFVTLVIAHITFDVPYVILNVMPKFRQMDPNLFEAAQDLGCSPFTALRKVILPEIMPGVVSGFLMSFTFSLDDFVISYFTSGSTSQTLPITIYSMTRRKISPEINALSTLIFVVVVIVLVVKHIIEIKQEQRNRANGGDEE